MEEFENAGPMEDELDVIQDIGVSLLMYLYQTLLVQRLRGGGAPRKRPFNSISHSMTADEWRDAQRRHEDAEWVRKGNLALAREQRARRREQWRRDHADEIEVGGALTVLHAAIQGMRSSMADETLVVAHRDYIDEDPDPGLDMEDDPVDIPRPSQSQDGDKLLTDMVLGPIPNARVGGYNMLNFKNMLTKKLHTHLIYNMNPVILGYMNTAPDPDQFVHMTGIGTGPHMYSTHSDDALTYMQGTDAGTNLRRNILIGRLNDLDTGYFKANDIAIEKRSLGYNSIVYVFAADWPFQTMNHDPDTQGLDYASQKMAKCLHWDYVLYEVNTDANLPYALSTIVVNRDWTYLTHYYTKYQFSMVNTSRARYQVEILFFTFKADPSAMDYSRQAAAPLRKQKAQMDEYRQNANDYPEDINIVYRKRITIGGLDNYNIMDNTNVTTSNILLDNRRDWSYTVKRKYVIKRPILSTYATTITESTFFNEYYEPEKGIYCRMQAWPVDEPFVVNNATAEGKVQINHREDTINQPTSEKITPNVSGTLTNVEFGFGVACQITKKSYFKLDEPMYKSYTKIS